MNDPRLNTIKKIANALNEKKIRWAIGGSTLLYLKGIVFEFNDLDLVVLDEDALKAREVLMALGAEYHQNKKASSTKVFDEFTFEGLDIDMVSGLTLTSFGKEYDCSFKNKDVEEMMLDGVKLRLDSLESWYEIYQLQDRIEKARYIKDFMLYHKK